MLIRFTLILAILGSIGAVVVNHVMVAEKVRTTVSQRDEWYRQLTETNKVLKITLKDLKDTQVALTTTSNKLVTTEQNLRRETARANSQEQRANGLQENLTRTTQQRDEAQQELAAYTVLGVTPGQIKVLIAQNADLKKEKEVMTEENKTLLRELNFAKETIDRLIGKQDQVEPPMPGVKGKIVAVDPKWDFVVLDIGADQGVRQYGRLLVSRNGKLLAKIKVTSVEKTRSVANVLPGWKLEDVMEGDVVLY